MANEPLGLVLRQLRQIGKAPAREPLTDGSLLERFAAGRDEAAFAALVERHGPMVLSVCRRVLHDRHEAEDVFQAAFLVLARRAGALDRRGSVAPWLHTVAFRLALRAKTQAGRWRRASRQVDDMAAVTPDPQSDRHELRSVLDEELDRLPAKYRAPVVLCYLEGKTVDETAAHLGWPRGTVGGRLARARDLLRRRLTRRGVTLGAAGLGAALASQAPAAVPAALAASTARAGLLFAAGGASAGTAATPAVLLAQGAVRTMMLHKLVKAAAVLLLLGTVSAGAGVLCHQALKQPASSAMPGNGTDPAPAGEAAAGPTDTPARVDANADPLPPGARTRLGTVRFRHGQPVTAVTFTADGHVLASAARDGTLRLWEAATGKPIRRFHISPGTACFGLSADGRAVAAPVPGPDDTTTIRVWDTTSGRETYRVEPGTVVSHVLLAPDGRSLVWGDGVGVHHRSLGEGKKVRTFQAPKGVPVGLALSADGKTLAASGPDHAVRVWEVATGKELCRIDGPQAARLHVALSPDGRTVATHADGDGVVRAWDVATRGNRAALALKDAGLLTGIGIPDQADFGNALAFSLDGRMLATSVAQGSAWSVVVWDAATGVRARVAPVPTLGAGGALSAVALSPDGRTLATGGLDNLVRVTDLTRGGFGGNLAGPHEGPVQAVAVTPDGKTLATACEYGGLHLWDAAGGRLLESLPEVVGPGNRLAFSPDGKLLATTNRQDFRITLWGHGAGWDVPGAHDQRVLEGHRQRVGALCFAADGRTLTSWGLDRTFRRWDVAAAREVGRATAAAEGVYAVAFAPDGRRAAGAARGAGDDATVVYLWDPATGAEVRRWDVRGCLVEALAWAHDGRTLAVAGRGKEATTIRLLDLAGGREAKRWTDPSHQRISALAFSPDDKALAAGSEGLLRLWEVSTAQQRAAYVGHQAPITSVAFAPDGKGLFTGSADTTALAWDLSATPAK